MENGTPIAIASLRLTAMSIISVDAELHLTLLIVEGICVASDADVSYGSSHVDDPVHE